MCTEHHFLKARTNEKFAPDLFLQLLEMVLKFVELKCIVFLYSYLFKKIK